MTNTVEHYENIGRRKGGSDLAKIRAILNEYASPGPSCIYDKSRTFALEVKDLLAQTHASDLAGFLERFNQHFMSGATKGRIKLEREFHRSLRAISNIVSDTIISVVGDGSLIVKIDLVSGDFPSAVGFQLSRLGFREQGVFNTQYQRLINALSGSRVDTDALGKIQDACASASGFEYSDLIQHADPSTGETPLHACVQASSSDEYCSAMGAISDLIARGATVNVRDHSGKTPLLKAAIMRVEALAHYLLFTHGADESITDRRGMGVSTFMRFTTTRALSVNLSMDGKPPGFDDVVSVGGGPAAVHPTLDLLAASRTSSAFTPRHRVSVHS